MDRLAQRGWRRGAGLAENCWPPDSPTGSGSSTRFVCSGPLCRRKSRPPSVLGSGETAGPLAAGHGVRFNRRAVFRGFHAPLLCSAFPVGLDCGWEPQGTWGAGGSDSKTDSATGWDKGSQLGVEPVVSSWEFAGGSPAEGRARPRTLGPVLIPRVPLSMEAPVKYSRSGVCL